MRGEQRVPEAGPELGQGRAGQGTAPPKPGGGSGREGSWEGIYPHTPLFSFSAKKEQRCPLGSGQSLPFSAILALTPVPRGQAQPGETGTATHTPAAEGREEARVTRAGPTGSHLSAAGSGGKSPHGAGANSAAGREAGRLVIGRLGHRAAPDWSLRKASGGWRGA